MIEVEDFSIKLPVFEGPFDLLLFFIEKDELDIQNIPIAKITDDFLHYIHQLNTLNIELASEFIFVAATLMRIKAKMLLPRPELDEDGQEIDLKKDLVQRLIEYKRFKEITEEFKLLEDERFFKERRGNINEDVKRLLENIDSELLEDFSSFNLYKLLKTYQKVWGNYLVKAEEVKHRIDQYPYSIEEQKAKISSLLLINKQLDFQNLKDLSKDKVQFVYNFLAILELLQQQLLEIQIGLGFNNFWILQKPTPAQ
ncbi:MAG: segregation/condensation protein A [Bacteroidetes bacterium]|nr:segregation/condensation protein A [Bacteroidota bacterium]MBU1483264.1 segregation/condensation protein A [Bacteroidota bacterium]MBU2268845.1 segregation/condensation protein A [Bacteroidota bacterium]MBU2377186.1 segregation/condensation protein A [Bacteroidota bacterium]